MTQFRYIQQAIRTFNSIDHWDSREIFGCTGEDLTLLEKLFPASYKLPTSYEEFLMFGGKRMAHFLGDPLFSYFSLLEIVNAKYSLLKKDFDLAEDIWDEGILIIDEHLSSNFFFIRLSEGDDPPVYFWEEEGNINDALKHSDHFSGFFLDTVEFWKESHLEAIAGRTELQKEVNHLKKEFLDIRDQLHLLNKNYPNAELINLKERFDDLSLSIYTIYLASIYKDIYVEIKHGINVEELILKAFRYVDKSLDPSEILSKINECKLLLKRIQLLEGASKSN